MPGQPQHPPVLSFNCSDIHVYETAGAMNPTTIVSAAAPFYLSADFVFSDAIAIGLVGVLSALPGPQWTISYSVESLGIGPEIELGSVSGNFVAGQLTYKDPATRLTVPAGKLPTGLYRLVAVVTLPKMPGVTGFYEGPTIQIY